MDMALAIAVGILIGVEYVADSIIIPLMKHYIHDGKKSMVIIVTREQPQPKISVTIDNDL